MLSLEHILTLFGLFVQKPGVAILEFGQYLQALQVVDDLIERVPVGVYLWESEAAGRPDCFCLTNEGEKEVTVIQFQTKPPQTDFSIVWGPQLSRFEDFFRSGTRLEPPRPSIPHGRGRFCVLYQVRVECIHPGRPLRANFCQSLHCDLEKNFHFRGLLPSAGGRSKVGLDLGLAQLRVPEVLFCFVLFVLVFLCLRPGDVTSSGCFEPPNPTRHP